MLDVARDEGEAVGAGRRGDQGVEGAWSLTGGAGSLDQTRPLCHDRWCDVENASGIVRQNGGGVPVPQAGLSNRIVVLDHSPFKFTERDDAQVEVFSVRDGEPRQNVRVGLRANRFTHDVRIEQVFHKSMSPTGS